MAFKHSIPLIIGSDYMIVLEGDMVTIYGGTAFYNEAHDIVEIESPEIIAGGGKNEIKEVFKGHMND